MNRIFISNVINKFIDKVEILWNFGRLDRKLDKN